MAHKVIQFEKCNEPTPPPDSNERVYTAPWTLNPSTRTWERSYLHRHFQTGDITDIELVHNGPTHRPGVLRDVVHLDVTLVALYSHPDTPGSLPEDSEGVWISTNPARPEKTVDSHLDNMGLVAAWQDSMPAQVVEFDGLIATIVYARPFMPAAV